MRCHSPHLPYRCCPYRSRPLFSPFLIPPPPLSYKKEQRYQHRNSLTGTKRGESDAPESRK